MAGKPAAGGFLKALGPGLLFAGAAIGVSHLVQSTRAGAVYGLALIVFVVAANIVKYPAFRIGNQYAPATGENLIVAYRRQGAIPLWLFVFSTLATMFVACAAISVTTAALAKASFNLPFDVFTIVLGVWAVVAAILFFGHYRALDIIVKVLLAFLTIATLLTTILVAPRISFAGIGDLWPASFDMPTVIFIAALVGWMPAPLDTAVWQSLWSQAKSRADKRAVTMQDSAVDFNVGFIGTAVLAVCFVLMGAGVMHGSGISFEDGAAGFARQIIELYESALGPAVAQLVGAAAMAVIFSTTLTAIDAWPRTLTGAALVIMGRGDGDERIAAASRYPDYWIGMAVLLVGAAVVLKFMMGSFSTLIDIATTISFLTAPIFAFLNHRAMFGAHVPAENRLGAAFRYWSAAGVVAMGGFAAFYLWIRFAA